MALSRDQIAQLWVQAGGNPNYAALMARIAKRESGGDPTAQNLTYPDHSIGLFQINQLAHKGAYGSDQALKDPLTNAKAAVALFKASKRAGVDPLSPWSTHNPAVDNKYIGQGARQASAAAAPPGRQQPAPQAVSPDMGAQRAALISQYLSDEHKPDALIGLATGLQSLKPVPVPKDPKQPAQPVEQAAPAQAAGGGQFTIFGANPGRLTPSLVAFAKKVAAAYGHPLSGNSGAGHSRLTVNGNVSDHWSGNATDIPASGATLLAMGRAALVAAGMPRAQAMKQTGGLFNVGGHQVIFLTNQGGNHYDHLHISV